MRSTNALRLLLIALAVTLVYVIVRGMTRASAPRRPTRPVVERIVPCAHCGLNLPEREALPVAGRFYCSEEHRRLAG